MQMQIFPYHKTIFSISLRKRLIKLSLCLANRQYYKLSFEMRFGREFISSKCLKILTVLMLCQVLLDAKVSSTLEIIKFSPLFFNLSFSEPTKLPQFQLLFNQIPISYTLLNNGSDLSTHYLMQGDLNGVDPSNYMIEKYVLIFSEPLLVANGNLDLNSFVLRARIATNQTEYILLPIDQKDVLYQYQNQSDSLTALAVVIASITYFLALTTVIGINAYHFLTIYCFISLHSQLFTALDFKIAYYMLLEIHQAGDTQAEQFRYILIPFIIILVTLIIGIICRFTLKNLALRSGFWNQLYYFLSYKLFLNCWQIMVIPIFVNTIHLIQDSGNFTEVPSVLSSLYIYFGCVCTALFSYTAFLSMNPQYGEKFEDWKKYVNNKKEIRHFNMLEGFHPSIEPHDWKKRNYSFFRSIQRLMIMIFIGLNLVLVPNIFFQILHLIYLFTIRPFKFDFFNYSNIGMQIFVVFFYLYALIVDLYTGISEEVTTSTDITRILLSYIIILCLIIFTYFGLGIYEFYERIKFVKINIEYFNNKKKSLLPKSSSLLKQQLNKSIFQTSVEEGSRRKGDSSFLDRQRRSKIKKTRKKSLNLVAERIILEKEADQEKTMQEGKKNRVKKVKEKESLLHNMVNQDD